MNLAVNNLLSRDDDEGDDADDASDAYMSDDLMSLLDAGIHTDHPSVIIDSDAAMFNEDMFSYSALRGRAAARGARTGQMIFRFHSIGYCIFHITTFIFGDGLVIC